MGSPLDPILAETFLLHHEENWVSKCPIEFLPSSYRRYVDDILYFLNHLKLSTRFENICHISVIKFTVEHKNDFSILFLDVKICSKNGKFVTSVYRQPTLGFSPIMKVSFQRTKREDFYTHYFIGVLAYVVISRHFILKLTI